MVSRRQILFVAAATLGLAPVVAWLSSPAVANRAGHPDTDTFRVRKTDAEWRRVLTDSQYDVLRMQGTEPPGSSPLNHEKRAGVFLCAGCGHPLFSSDAKFESGTGWPSFVRPLEGAVMTRIDRSIFMVRSEVICAECGGHLGHVFDDGPKPTGLRYCMNGAAMTFEASRS